MSNVNHSFQNNEVKDPAGKAPEPSSRPQSSTPKSIKQKMLRSFCKTPTSTHKKHFQTSTDSYSTSVLSPYKSRFEVSSIPKVSVNVNQCKFEISQLELEHKALLLSEHKMMDLEWTQAKKSFKLETETSLAKHEGEMVKQKNEFKKLLEIQEKTKRLQHQIDKKSEFLAMIEAKRKLKAEDRQKEADRIQIEKEKSLKANIETLEKRNLIKQEKEAKRQAFLESLQANKRLEMQEQLRMKKEKEFEVAVEVTGKRKVLQESCNNQRRVLEHTENLIFN